MASPEELVRRAKQGDRMAFDELMEKYQREVITVAFRMLGQYEDSLEVAQEAFFRAYRGLSRFREEAAFRTWLYQIVLNLCRHRRRWYARHRVGQTISLDAPLEAEGSDTMADRVADPSVGPREEATRREIQETIRRALEQLPVPFKTILVLRDIEGLSYEEISAICKEPVGTVKSRLHRARAMLRAKLTERKPNHGL